MLNILLVEDNKADMFLIENALESIEGSAFSILKADSMRIALKMLKLYRFDVALLDLNLPETIGTESVMCFRSQNNEIPIVAITGMHDEDLAAKALAAGAQEYLVKDMLNPESLEMKIHYSMVNHLKEKTYRAIFD